MTGGSGGGGGGGVGDVIDGADVAHMASHRSRNEVDMFAVASKRYDFSESKSADDNSRSEGSAVSV